MKKVHRVILISGSIVIIGLLIFGIFLFINKKQNKLESPINDNVALLAEIGNDKETESDNYAAVSDETEKADDTSPENAKDKTSDGYEIEDDVNIISSEAPVKKTIDGGEIPSSKNSDNYSDIQSDNNSKEQETVTITVNAEQIGDGEFRYSVHNYSNESPISQSDAVVRIYKGNTLIQDPIQAPNDISDKVWYVFSITKDGIIMKNESYNASSSSVQ